MIGGYGRDMFTPSHIRPLWKNGIEEGVTNCGTSPRCLINTSYIYHQIRNIFILDLKHKAPVYFQSPFQKVSHQFNRRVSVIQRGEVITLTRGHISTIPSQNPHPSQNTQYIDARYPTKEQKDNLTKFSKKATIMAATDGSVKEGKATFGWVVSTLTGPAVKGGGKVYPQHNTMSSQRSELAGLLSCMRFIASSIQSGDIQIFCDSKSAIRRVRTGSLNPKNSLYPNMDLVIQILEVMKLSQCKFNINWIRSHSDRKQKELTPAQKLNIIADNLATEMHLEMTPIPHSIPQTTQITQVYIHDKIVSSHYSSNIMKHACLIDTKSYWDNKKSVPSSTNFDSSGFIKSWALLSPVDRPLTAKLIYGWASSGDQYTSNLSHRNLCPLCCYEETPSHVLECTSPTAIKIKHEHEQKLRKKLLTSPSMWGLTEVVNRIFESTEYPETHHLIPTSSNLSKFNLACGFLPRDTQLNLDRLNENRARPLDLGKSLHILRTEMWSMLRSLWINRVEGKFGTGTRSSTLSGRTEFVIALSSTL